jgi:hypothetical protein
MILWISNFNTGFAEGRSLIDKEDLKLIMTSFQGLKFQSELESDFQLKLVHNNQKVEYLEAQVDYTDNLLKVTGLEAVNLEELLTGEAKLQIDYRMGFSNQYDNKGPLGKAESNSGDTEPNLNKINNETTDTFHLGKIQFHRSMDEIFWRISNKNGSWGMGIRDISLPDIIRKILPEYINGLIGDNNITSISKEAIHGTITIYTDYPQARELSNITLDNFDLPKEIINKIIANGEKSSKLEVVANYNFYVPLYPLQAGQFRTLNLSPVITKPSKHSFEMDNQISFRFITTINHK